MSVNKLGNGNKDCQCRLGTELEMEGVGDVEHSADIENEEDVLASTIMSWWVHTGSMHVDSAFRIFPHLLKYSWTFAPQTSPAILFDFTNLWRSSIL